MTQPARVSGGSATGETSSSSTTVSGSFTISSGTARALFIVASRELAGTEAALTPTSVVITGESNEAHLVIDEFCNDSTDVKTGLYVLWDSELPANGSYTVTVTYSGSSSTAQSVIVDLWEYVKQDTIPSGAQVAADNDPGNPVTVDVSLTTSSGATNHLILCAAVEGAGNPWEEPIETGFTNSAQVASGSQSDAVLSHMVDTGGGGDAITITPLTYLNFGSNRMAAVAASFEEYVAPAGPDYTLVMESVSYTSSPQDVSMLASRKLVADAVSYSTSVQDISMLVSRLLTADAVIYSLALQDIETLVTRQMTLDAATYTHSPQDITMAVTKIMALDPVSYSCSAQDITMLVSRLLTMDEVTFTASPQDITMSVGYTFTLDPVTFSMSAQDVIILLSRVLTAEAVTFTFAPQDITMTLGNTYTLVADAVSYSLTVQDADLLASRVLTAEPAIYVLNIQGVTIYAGVVYDSQGYFTVTIMDQVIDVVIQDAAIDVIIQDEIQDVIV